MGGFPCMCLNVCVCVCVCQRDCVNECARICANVHVRMPACVCASQRSQCVCL